MRLFEKLNAKKDNRKKLVVPRVITLMQKCVEHKIQDCFIQRLHFNDLYVLLLSLDIAQIKQTLSERQKMERQKRNMPSVQDISQNDAIKFLKGG